MKNIVCVLEVRYYVVFRVMLTFKPDIIAGGPVLTSGPPVADHWYKPLDEEIHMNADI